MEIHESAALCHAGHPFCDSLINALSHGLILVQCPGIQLRISPVQQKTPGLFGNFLISQRGKPDNLSPHIFKQAEIILIEKAKRLISCRRNGQRLLKMPGKTGIFQLQVCLLKLRRLLCQLQETVQVHGFFQYIRQTFQALPEIRNFLRLYQPQMTAVDDTVCHLRHIAQHFYIQIFFQEIFHTFVHHGGKLIQNHPPYLIVSPKFQKTFHISRHGQTHASAVQHKHRRCTGHTGQFIGAGMNRNTAHAVIKAHHAFHHCNIRIPGILCQQITGNCFTCKECIQVPGFCPQHLAVEHRVYIIRTAFKRSGFQPPLLQCLEDSAGNQRLPAAAGPGPN